MNTNTFETPLYPHNVTENYRRARTIIRVEYRGAPQSEKDLAYARLRRANEGLEADLLYLDLGGMG